MEHGSQEVIIGKNAVIEALQAGINIDKIFIIKGEKNPGLRHIAAQAREAGAAVIEADKRKLDKLCADAGPEAGMNHQGIVAMAACVSYSTVSEILSFAGSRNEQPLIIVCDEISDPHNLGAIIRTGEAAGAHGIIIPKRRSAGLTAAVAKSSSGAVFHIRTAKVPNITEAIRDLKKQGVWIFGASADGEAALWDTDFTGAVAFVIGSEGKGLGRLVKDTCDFTVSIPMSGRISSLNASVSASILLYEAFRQRR